MDNKIEIGFQDKIDIVSIVRDILKQWWVILLLSASVALFTEMWVSANYHPEYTTTTTFAVTAKGMNTNVYQNLTTTKELAGRLSQVLDSVVLKKKVAEDLGMKEFDAETSVQQVQETNLLTVTVTAGAAMEAYHIIESIMRNYNTVSDYVIENVILETIQPPMVPIYPSNPIEKRKTVQMAFLIAALIFAACFAGVSMIRDTIKNSKEVEEKIDAKLLGTIWHERKNKLFGKSKNESSISMLIQNPLRSFRYVEANKMTASKMRSRMDKVGAKVVLFTSVMENEGKSTAAANIALALSQEGKRVMLIDCDFRKPAQYKIFEVPSKETLNLPKVLRGEAEVENLIGCWNDTNLYTIFNKTAASSMESLLKSGMLKNILRFCRTKMDYVIVDASPLALVADTEELAQMMDASVLVIKEDTVLTKDINDAIDVLNNTKGKVLGCILNNAVPGLSGNSGHYGYGYGGHYGKRAE